MACSSVADYAMVMGYVLLSGIVPPYDLCQSQFSSLVLPQLSE